MTFSSSVLGPQALGRVMLSLKVRFRRTGHINNLIVTVASFASGLGFAYYTSVVGFVVGVTWRGLGLRGGLLPIYLL